MNEGMAPQDVDSFAISRNPRANLSRKVLSPSLRKPQAALVPGRVRNSLRASGIAERLADELGLSEPECVTERMPNGET